MSNYKHFVKIKTQLKDNRLFCGARCQNVTVFNLPKIQVQKTLLLTNLSKIHVSQSAEINYFPLIPITS